MTEYSPLPGTFRSNTREVTDEPWTKNTTGRAGSPGFGAPTRLRNIHRGISPFFAQYSLLQISPSAAAVAMPSPLMTARRDWSERDGSECVMTDLLAVRILRPTVYGRTEKWACAV